jgi:hypothetical protein
MPTNPSISLKIDPVSKKELSKIAESKNASISQIARDILVESLSEDNQLALLKMEVLALKSEMKELRTDLRVATEALLVSCGNLPPEEAREWTQKNMK